VELEDTQVSGTCGSNPVGVRVPPSAFYPMKKGRVAIFLSGRGSNFEAIFQTSKNRKCNFEIVVVISDQKDARGLKKAKEFCIPAYSVSRKQYGSKDEYEKQLVLILKKYAVDLVCLAGYMRIVGGTLLKAYKNRILNIHPALLPAFPGLNAQKQALEYGVGVSGCTVHFVDEGVDSGPIILQKTVEVLDNDTEESLSDRILKEEHILYSQAICLFFEKRLKFEGRRVIILKK
jgi:phosphoribosylglycinamide formyltransferase-1